MALNLKSVEPHFRDQTIRQKLCLLKHIGGLGCDVCFPFEKDKHTQTGYHAYQAFSLSKITTNKSRLACDNCTRVVQYFRIVLNTVFTFYGNMGLPFSYLCVEYENVLCATLTRE